MSALSDPLAAVVIPPREGFGPDSAGALGLLAHHLAATPGFRTIVLGGPQSTPPFQDVEFHAARPAFWWLGNVNQRFAASVAVFLRRRRPACIEVHNRPETAVSLARWLPSTPVSLHLNNDPQVMRCAANPAERTALLARVARVIVSSDYLRQRFLEGVEADARRVVVLPNCIDISALPPARTREKTILFAGRIVAEKAPDAFITACADALPRLPGWSAELIGADRFRNDSPETAFVASTRAAAQAAGVHYSGYRNHAAVLEAMARAAIVVVPSRWQEPFGLVALEALASGAVLICAPRGGLPEVAEDAAVYAEPNEPGALSSAILRLASDPDRRAALAAAGRRRAQEFDVGVITARLAALRHEVLSDPGIAAGHR
ncbi:MAG: glycosyltransferase family 4 protein [Acetobacteraceae bacterium]|nr:glycosyltransferase family 4 protein [Acetobacteraceae bacterium]